MNSPQSACPGNALVSANDGIMRLILVPSSQGHGQYKQHKFLVASKRGLFFVALFSVKFKAGIALFV
jgi:hypothetical protein